MIRHSVFAFLSLAVLVTSGLQAEEKDKGHKLDGTYTVVSGERGGAKIPADQIEGSIITFTKDKVVGTDKDKKEFYSATYTLDTTGKPHRITMVSTSPKAGEKAMGIIEVDGDTVKVAYALPGGNAPTEFKTKENQQSFVLKKKSTDK